MRHFSTLTRVLAVLALLTAGCSVGAEPGPEGAEDTELKDFFGNLGDRADYLRCPTVVGFYGRAGVFLDSVGLICAGNGTFWRTNQYGTGGGDDFTLTCPAGFVGFGIQGNSGKYIVSMQLICRSSTGSQYFTESKGGSTGSGFTFTCPQDQKLIGFDVANIPYVNGVRPVCAPL